MGFLVLKVLKYGLQPRVSIPQYLKVYDGTDKQTQRQILQLTDRTVQEAG